MNKIKILMVVLFMPVFSAFSSTTPAGFLNSSYKDPVVIEVITKHTSVEDALVAAKTALLAQKFITSNGIQQNSFTATRTTMSKADYYVADVTATKKDGKIKLTISFVKVGTGFLRLQKIADEVKAELEK